MYMGNMNNIGSIITVKNHQSPEEVTKLINDLWDEWKEMTKGIYTNRAKSYIDFVSWIVMTGAFYMYSKVLEMTAEWPRIEVVLKE